MSNRIAIVVAVALFAAGTTANAQIFGLKSADPPDIGTPSQPPTNLFKFNTDGTGFMDLGVVKLFNQDVDADALAMAPDGTLFAYVLQSTGSQLVTIDPDTAVATPIGLPLIDVDARGAEMFGPGALVIVDAAGDQLIAVDPSDGMAFESLSLTMGDAPFDVSTITDISVFGDAVVLANNDTLYSIGFSDGEETDDGELTAIGGQDGAGFAGIAADKSTTDVFLYEVNGTDDIFEVDPTSEGPPVTLLIENIIPSFNSGRGDLAGMLPFEDDPTNPEIPAPAALPAGLLLIGIAATRRRR